MKRTLTYLFSLICFFAQAQESPHLEPPKTHWQSYGFQKQVEQVGIGYYKNDSLGYEPTMLEVYTFNKDGYLIQKYNRIFGKYASETANNYVYDNGVLDSINTIASASNFSSKQKLHYNQSGGLESITASGTYTNFTDDFSWDDGGRVINIERKYQNGGKKEAVFNAKSNYVQDKQTDLKGKITEHYHIYDGDKLFASVEINELSVVTFYDAWHRSDFKIEVEKDALNYTLKWRNLKNKDPEKFDQEIAELIDKPTSTIIFEIPAETKNDDGDWIKRLEIDNGFFGAERRLVFKTLVYSDGTQSGSTEYDLIFENRVSQMK